MRSTGQGTGHGTGQGTVRGTCTTFSTILSTGTGHCLVTHCSTGTVTGQGCGTHTS